MSGTIITLDRLYRADERDIEVYRKCFSDNRWCSLYGVSTGINDVDRYLQEVAVQSYPTVQRYIFRVDSKGIGFAHSNAIGKTTCVSLISGGVIPSIMGKGWGTYCILCFVDYICQKDFDYVCCKINRSNHVSRKLAKRLGFVTACKIDVDLNVTNISSDDRDVYLLRESDFPNGYSESLLNKINYHVK